MTITIDANMISLLLIGFVAGTAAASIMGGHRAPSMWLQNGVIGILGAFLGKIIFDLLNITIPEILTGTITVADILVALTGALVLMFVARRVL
ncbi:MAG: GlsB/YeaQ/YmgE family stress response membrane protein [Chloroflexi bacterium]|nr:GlsB/YeaQ/YmgE family stress response membrane protein [Chloroflexota bacterium]